MFPEKNEKLGNIDKKVANPLRINDFHFGRLRREQLHCPHFRGETGYTALNLAERRGFSIIFPKEKE